MNFEDLIVAVRDGEEEQIIPICQAALKEGASPIKIIEEGLTEGMLRAGRLFEQEDYFLPEMLISSMALQKGLDYLAPYLKGERQFWKGTVVIGTVEGDTHDIGKNLVGAMLQATGFRVYDLGVDVTAEQFVEAIQNYHPDILAMSALLSTTMMNMKTTISALSGAGLRESIKVMIGGAVVSQRFADLIGADGYSEDAAAAAALAEKLVRS